MEALREKWIAGYSSNVQGVINAWGAIGDTSWMRGSNVPVFSVHGLNDTTEFYERVPSYKVFKAEAGR